MWPESSLSAWPDRDSNLQCKSISINSIIHNTVLQHTCTHMMIGILHIMGP